MIELIIIIISLALGSFGNNIISYFSGQSKFDILRSRCLCGEKILITKELIPILSYIFLKGKCLFCKIKLPVRYLMIELLTPVIGLLCHHYFGISLTAVLNFFLFYCLLLIGTIDLLTFTIPNILITLLFVLSVFKQYLNSIDNIRSYNLFLCLVVPLFFILFNYFFRKVRGKNAIGFGDIKLIFVLALVFQILILLIGIWISSITAIIGFYLLKIFSPRFKDEYRIPFGFFLSIGFLLLGFLEKQVIEIYKNIVGL